MPLPTSRTWSVGADNGADGVQGGINSGAALDIEVDVDAGNNTDNQGHFRIDI